MSRDCRINEEVGCGEPSGDAGRGAYVVLCAVGVECHRTWE